jgi:hypothetical protein
MDKSNTQLQSLKFSVPSTVVSADHFGAKGKEGWERMSDDDFNLYSSQRDIVQKTTVDVRSDRME